MRKKILILLAALIIAVGGVWTLAGCSEKTYEDGFFKYQIIEPQGSDKYVSISGLTESGKQQKVIVIPKKIKGIEVGCFGDLRGNPFAFNYSGTFADFESDKLEKLFIPASVSKGKGFAYLDNIKKIIRMGVEWYDTTSSKFYFSKKYANEHTLSSKNKIANIMFLYNDGTDNDYWIDDVEYNDIIEYVPENPQREGYKFGGWYKEISCINEWKFEVDRTPEIRYDEENNVIYQETILYAKWLQG